MNEQPEALRLAEIWEDYLPAYNYKQVALDTASELRRQHEEIKVLHQRHHDDNVEYTRVLAQRDALLEALQDLCDTLGECGMTEKARAAIAAAEGEGK